MKKVFFLFATLCVFQINYAQEIADHAIGLRIGSNDGLGSEISYQHGLSNNNRIEADLGWRSSNDFKVIKLTGLYQWVWQLENNFNWYAGVGGGFLSWKLDNKILKSTNGSALFVAGDIGIEYKFDIPLLISLDMRPELGFNKDYSDDLDLDIALSVRYTF